MKKLSLVPTISPCHTLLMPDSNNVSDEEAERRVFLGMIILAVVVGIVLFGTAILYGIESG